MLINDEKWIPEFPAKFPKATIVRALRKYAVLFDTVGPALINGKPFFLNNAPVRPTMGNLNSMMGYLNPIINKGNISICPLMLSPGWYEFDLNGVMEDANEVWDNTEFYRVKERDYALLNELKWYLIFKYITDLDWENSPDEARMLETLQIFATLLELYYNSFEYDPTEFGASDYENLVIYLNEQVYGLFSERPEDDAIPVMNAFIRPVWDRLVVKAQKNKRIEGS